MFKVITDPESGAVQAERDLAKRAEAHRATRAGQWEVACTIWQHPERKTNNVEVITTTEASDRCLVASGGQVTNAGADFVQLMPRISGLQQKTPIIIKGVEYDMKDFRVRIGRVFEKQNPMHVVIEIEYRPCLIVEECQGLIHEMLDFFLKPQKSGHGETQQPQQNDDRFYQASRVMMDFKKTPLKDRPFFSLKHAAHLYIKLLTNG